MSDKATESTQARDSSKPTREASAKKTVRKKAAAKKAVKKAAKRAVKKKAVAKGMTKAGTDERLAPSSAEPVVKAIETSSRETGPFPAVDDSSHQESESSAKSAIEGDREDRERDIHDSASSDRRSSRSRWGRRGRRGSGRGQGSSESSSENAPESRDSGYTGDRARRDQRQPREKEHQPAVLPARIRDGVKRARKEIVAVLDEVTNISSEDEFYVKEIELTLSFDENGRFIGIGTGGVATVKVRLAPDDL